MIVITLSDMNFFDQDVQPFFQSTLKQNRVGTIEALERRIDAAEDQGQKAIPFPGILRGSEKCAVSSAFRGSSPYSSNTAAWWSCHALLASLNSSITPACTRVRCMLSGIGLLVGWCSGELLLNDERLCIAIIASPSASFLDSPLVGTTAFGRQHKATVATRNRKQCTQTIANICCVYWWGTGHCLNNIRPATTHTTRKTTHNTNTYS